MVTLNKKRLRPLKFYFNLVFSSVNRTSNFMTLLERKHMKKFISLIVGIFAFALLIQPVFATSEADLEALIADETVVACADNLVASYATLDTSAGIDNAVVDGYYTGPFAETYGEGAVVDDKLAALDDKGYYLQYHYLANNPADLGAKDTLNDAADGSDWSAAHAGCHADNLAAKLGDDGSYDYFVIDTDGNIVYTVYKETDLGTNLTSGSFADSGLGQAYAASVADGGALAVSDVAAYWPSYEADAQFVCSAIGDAGATFCLQITPDQLADTGDIRED